MKHGKWRLKVYGALALVLCACGANDQSDLQHWIQEIKALPVTSATPLPLAKHWSFTPHTYLEEQGINPFNQRRLAGYQETDSVQRLFPYAQTQHQDSQHTVSLEQMQMVGSIQKSGEIWALIRIKQQTYLVQVGDYLGLEEWRVMHIEQDRLLLRNLKREKQAGESIDTVYLALKTGDR